MLEKVRRFLYNLSSSIILSIPIRIIRVGYLRLFLKQMGDNIYIGKGVDVKSPENIILGNNIVINKKVLLDGRRGLTIGDNVDIAQEVAIWSEQHDYDNNHALCGGAVVIGDYCWVCHRAIILPCVKLGKGVVVACSSVVTKSVGDNKVVGGIPARVISTRKNKPAYKLIYKPRFWDQL